MKKFLFTIAFILPFVFSSYGQLKVISSGYVGIGTSTPEKPLEVIGQVLISNSDAYPFAKQSTMLMRHYSDPAVNFAYFKAQSSATQNSVNFGGGAGVNYAATSLSFFTTNNTTTTNGSVRMRIRFDGKAYFNTDASTGATYPTDLNVWGTAGKPGGGTWTAISDRRLKTGVREYTDGLNEVLRINPVFFKYDQDEVGGTKDAEYVGVIAQDMQKVAPYTVSEVEWANEEHRSPYETILTYDGTAIPYMLINAIKAQQLQIQDKDDRITELENALIALTEKVNAITKSGVSTNSNQTINLESKELTSLAQNRPNPFSNETEIDYAIPTTFQNASLRIMDANGQLVHEEAITVGGTGTVKLKTTNMPSGQYHYSLLVDGKVQNTKSMLLAE